jgi:hypothetical protein
MPVARSIAKLLTSPNKVAQALDWKKASGSILSLNVCRNGIDIAIASHPSSDEPIEHMPTIPLKLVIQNHQKILARSVIDDIVDIVNENQVCGMVVSWPVQKEGWCGAPCGRVLHALDQITAQSNILNGSRPICLWDTEHNLPQEDEWGRDPVYAIPSEKTEHRASIEQYQDHSCQATDIWNDFSLTHWPEYYLNQQKRELERAKRSLVTGKQTTRKPNVMDINPTWMLNAYEDSAAYSQAALS